MPIGMPGWPDFAASTASIASARIALASCLSVARAAVAETVMFVDLSKEVVEGRTLQQ